MGVNTTGIPYVRACSIFLSTLTEITFYILLNITYQIIYLINITYVVSLISLCIKLKVNDGCLDEFDGNGGGSAIIRSLRESSSFLVQLEAEQIHCYVCTAADRPTCKTSNEGRYGRFGGKLWNYQVEVTFIFIYDGLADRHWE
jgi:hypothetical protein